VQDEQQRAREQEHAPVPETPPEPSRPARPLATVGGALVATLLLLALAALATQRVIEGPWIALFALPLLLFAGSVAFGARNARRVTRSRR